MSGKSLRIRTKVGEEPHVIPINLDNSYDVLEVLSLKFSPTATYLRYCADYGVVIGRVSAQGKGLPNARVSVFVPIEEEDKDNPIVSTLYPYTSVVEKNEDGYRYNLLPYEKQHSGHTPTGTFPSKEDVLYNQDVNEIFEKYYKLTAKTNQAGDFMIWGVPLNQTSTFTIHVDIDLSDMGCMSLRPYDLMRQGVAQLGQFENSYKFKSSADIDSLPQIVKFDKTIEVAPFWGADKDTCQPGITRVDFDLAEIGLKIEPTAMFMGSIVTDAGKLAINKNGKPKKRQGYKCKLETYEGTVEAIRFTGRKYKTNSGEYYPELEKIELDTIDENGTWMCALPMNMDYIITNEFGDEEYTNDPNQGIATSGIYRFRVGFNYDDPKMEVGYYLVPNIREFNNRKDGHINESDVDTKLSYTFSDEFEDYIQMKDASGNLKTNNQIKELILGTHNDNVPEDYFYKFTYNKVYSVSSFHGTHFEGRHRDAFVGIKEIVPNEDQDCDTSANKMPVNFGYRNRISFQIILAQILLFFKYLITLIYVRLIEILGHILYSIGSAIAFWPLQKLSDLLRNLAFKLQEGGQTELPLTIYPICEECGVDQIEEGLTDISLDDLNGCIVASGLTNFGLINLVKFNALVVSQGGFSALTPSASECPSATPINYNELGDLHNRTITSYQTEGFTNRYALVVSPMSGTTSGVLLLTQNGPHFELNNGNYLLQFASMEEALEFAGEVDPLMADTYYSTGSASGLYKFEIYDLQGNYRDDIALPPTVDIEEGCKRYDKFYNESLERPNYAYVWAVRDEDYGSPLVSIVDQNNQITNTTTPYGGGIYPAFVMKYTSYSSIEREIVITGLDSGELYEVMLVGSKRYNNTNGEATVFTIGGESKILETTNNLLNAATFSNVSPLVDRILIRMEGLGAQDYNYINGLTITSSGGQTINININPSFDVHLDPTWNHLIIPIGQQTSISYLNLLDATGTPTGINIELSYSENVATNDTMSQLQPIYNCTIKTSCVVPNSPYDIEHYSVIATVAATSTARELPSYANFPKLGARYYERKTKTGYTEIRNGVITIVPVIRGKSNTAQVIKEWYNRNRISVSFCGGIVNHSFIDNWLTGLVYAFKFKYRKGARNWLDGIINGRSFKYPRELVYFDTRSELFYYRSTPYDKKSKSFIGQVNNYAHNDFREILRPTTIMDLGPRDEFMDEICASRKVDPNCSVIRDIGATSYQNIEQIIEYAINYRMDISKSGLKVKDFFNRKIGGVFQFDGDIVQLESINCEAGIEEFEMDDVKYNMYSGDLLDPDNPDYKNYFSVTALTSTGQIQLVYGPTPIDMKLDDNGRKVRLCINHPEFLGEYSQVVPFYLWDKKGEGFGSGGNLSDQQDFKRNIIYTQKLQEMMSANNKFDFVITTINDLSKYSPLNGRTILVLNTGTVNNPLTGEIWIGDGYSWQNGGPFTKTSNYMFSDGTEEYMLYPMTKEHDIITIEDAAGQDAFERFDYISTNSSDRFKYLNAPENTLFLQVILGTVNDPISGQFWVMKNNQWVGPYQYIKGASDVFISPTANNYEGNLQVLSTPFLFYFGYRPGRTSYDRFINYFGPKGAFDEK